MHVTSSAATMIIDLVQQRALPDGAGLRIAPRTDHRALTMSLAEQADPDDVVVEIDSARVFLAPVADLRLAGAVLDARRNRSGAAFFVQP